MFYVTRYLSHFSASRCM